MAKELERDLGLYAVITISIGAMIGSGIFVLPGLAAKIAGPAVILAYPLAALIVLPAALSKAEMATAMPESGGTYLYIDRAMGPMMGTIAGLGVWFSLVFKSSFALMGLGAYLLLFAAGVSTKVVAIGLAIALVIVNTLGAKQTGGLQAVIVTTVLALLGLFIFDGFGSVDTMRFTTGLFKKGVDGLLAATGFVFVSYAGVTKIASVAEEVEDPDRNIPIGILASIGIMMLVYTAIVYVVIGVTDPEGIQASLTPMADAADAFIGPIFGPWGAAIMSATAVLALTSMANAGILSSSRYPFAMARDALAPAKLKEISQRFTTPINSILITGALMLLLIAFIPVVELAKLASAFKILIFMLINAALIAFREGDAEGYDPAFRSPLYPWVQFFGILGGAVLLTQMGTLPLVGAAVLLFGGLAFYQLYGKKRTAREGAAVHAIRQRAGVRKVQATKQALDEPTGFRVLVPIGEHTPREKEALLVRLAADLAREEDGSVQVIMFEQVPDQTVLPAFLDRRTPEEIAFEELSSELIADLDVPVEVGEVVSHDAKRAVVNYATSHGADLILADAELSHEYGRLFGRGMKWLVDKAPCDVALVKRNDGIEDIGSVAMVSDGGTYDPFKVRLANAIAMESGAPILFIHAVEPEVTEERLQAIRGYHEELGELCSVQTNSIVLRDEHKVDALLEVLEGTDIVIMEAAKDRLFTREPMADLPKRIASELGETTLLAYPQRKRRRGPVGRLVDRVLY